MSIKIKTKHPIEPVSSLSLKEQYNQIKALSSSNLAFNPTYSAAPEQQPVRWHIRFDGRDVISMLCSGDGAATKKWCEGPQLTPKDLGSSESIITHVVSILDGTFPAPIKKPKGVGVILHLSNTGTISPVKDNFKSFESFDSCALLAVDAIEQVSLSDVSQQTAKNRWRAFPVPGGLEQQTLLFRLSTSDMEGVSGLGDLEIPVTFSIRNGEMETICAGLRLSEGISNDEIDGKTKTQILAFYFKKHTLFAVCNEKGVPSAIKLLPQSEGSAPVSIKQEFSSMLQMSSGSTDFICTIFPCTDGYEVLVDALESKVSSTTAEIHIQTLDPEDFPDLLNSMGQPVNGITKEQFFPLEFVFEYPKLLLSSTSLDRASFHKMIESASQNYAYASSEVEASQPSSNDAKFVILSRGYKIILGLILLSLVSFYGFSVYLGITSKEWKVDPSELAALQHEESTLQEKYALYEQNKSIIESGVPAWALSKLLLDLFPETREFILERASINVNTNEDGSDSISISFSGNSREMSPVELQNLRNPAYISNVFNSIGQSFDLEIMNIEPNQVITGVREEQSSSFNPEEEAFPVTFQGEITISGIGGSLVVETTEE